MKFLVAWIACAIVLGFVVRTWTWRWTLVLVAGSLVLSAAFYSDSISI